MKEFLGDLPRETERLFEDMRRGDPTVPPRVFVPTRPTVLNKGERVRVMAVVPGGQRVARVSLVTRPGAGAPWGAAPMTLRGRRTYQADLVWIDAMSPLLDYYVLAEVTGGGRATRCTAPLEAPERYYSVTLVA